MSQLIFYVLIAIAAPVMIGRLYRDASTATPGSTRDGAGFVMVFPRSQWVLAWVLLLLIAGGPLVAMGKGALRFPAMAATMVSFGGLPALAFLWSRRYAIAVTPAALVASSPWRGRIELPWEGVAALEWARYRDGIRFKGRDGETITVPSMLTGIDLLEAECRRRLAPGLVGDAFEKLHARRGRYASQQTR